MLPKCYSSRSCLFSVFAFKTNTRNMDGCCFLLLKLWDDLAMCFCPLSGLHHKYSSIFCQNHWNSRLCLCSDLDDRHTYMTALVMWGSVLLCSNAIMKFTMFVQILHSAQKRWSKFGMFKRPCTMVFLKSKPHWSMSLLGLALLKQPPWMNMWDSVSLCLNYLLPHLCLFLSPGFLSNPTSVSMMSQKSMFHYLLSKIAMGSKDVLSPALFLKLHLNWKTAAWNSVPSWSKYADIHIVSLCLQSVYLLSELISMLKCIKTLSLTMYLSKIPRLDTDVLDLT